jgi:excisionase family DNA binding protein
MATIEMIPAKRLLLTEREAAMVLAVCPKTVRNMTKRGEISRIKIGTAVRYDPADLQGWI